VPAQSALVTQALGQVVVTPSQRYGAQLGLPTELSGTAVHVPTLPDTLQASHAFTQPVLQQKPSTQLPLWHSLPSVQVPPLPFKPAHWFVASQKVPLEQSALLTQLVGQLVMTPSHKYGVQLGAPEAPSGTVVQLPTVPARLQLSQLAPQALLQHTPSAQNPLWHSRAPAQLAPMAFLTTHWLTPLQ
jgi:hypothetical protein